MKILLNRKPVDGPWGGGNLLVRALCEILPHYDHEVVHEFSNNIDVIFMTDPRYSELGISINEIMAYKHKKPNVRIIHRVNECDARKGTDDIDPLLRACSSYTDMTVFVSKWMMKYHLDRGWNCSNCDVIINGVDHDHFKSREKIKNGKINIVTHHWANNMMKGFDIYNAIDEFVGKSDTHTFTYIGRDLGTFKNTNVIEPIFGEELGKMLSKFDVYVSGSRFDPGPNHILESLACYIPTYVHPNGGGAVEFADSDHVFDNVSHLLDILQDKQFVSNSMKTHGWEDCVKQYEKVIQRMFL